MAGRRVPAGADRERQVVVAGEAEGEGDVRVGGHAHEGGGPAVDHPVEARAQGVVVRVGRRDDPAGDVDSAPGEGG